MSRQTKKHGDMATADPSARVRELFARWTAEEEAGYEGEVSWEGFKEALDAERRSPEYRKLFSPKLRTAPMKEVLGDG